MRRYDTFNPAIPEDTDYQHVEGLPSFDEIQKGNTVAPTLKEKNHRKKRETAKTKKTDKKETSAGFFTSVSNFFQSRTLRWMIGLFMAFFAVYLGIAFISYFVTCVKDQSEINNTPIGFAGEISNMAGEGGARLSEFLINEFFGIGSFVIIIWLFAVGLRLIAGMPKFKPVNFTIKCLVGLITLSLIVGLVTIGVQTSVNWGGYHGRYVNEFIIHFLGWSGAVILCIFMVCCFVGICMRDVVKWLLKQKDKYKEKRRIRREHIEAIKAREREIDAMRKAEDQIEGHQELSSETDEESKTDKPLEVSFDDEAGLYSQLPDFDDSEYTYNLEEDKNNIYNSIARDSLQDKNIEKPTVSENNETHEEYLKKFQPKNDIDSSKINGENVISSESVERKAEGEDKTEEIQSDIKEETSEKELEMVVNVNNISQVNGKSVGINTENPGHFPYKFPPFEILAPSKGQISVDADEQYENKELIKRTLLDFDIPIVSIEATVGPTVTLYEIVPDKGIRVSKIRSLVDDIALSLSAEGIRIIAPIPGKGTVGIEVANKDKQMVSMRTVLKSPAFHETKFKLPIAMGSTISNEVYMADLSKMPHLLVAGATGQGKSVGLNAIIASLLYSKRPDELKFVMIDPKMVEFSLYAKIEGHYLAKIPDAEDAIITDMDKVVATLSSLCIEMDNRYQLLKAASVRNIIEYNEKIKDKKLNPNEGHKFLPYIVVIVDEFSDLIMTAGKEVEVPIARLAQKARAVGMHVIIATQRPSANVITGIIRANFPARMAFKVSSGIDSKVILDTTGAQALIGRGDMLISNSSPMVRVQCAFIDTPEVEKICDHISAQPYAQGAYILPEPLTAKGDGAEEGGGGISGERDPLFEEVARLVVHSNNASTSSLQRRYSIGYNRAGKIMDQLEAAGIVGPAQGGKPRAVLMDPVSLDMLLGEEA
ncbi:MAG: DNA translocase FtsK [Muribaculaceae bacterium]|nr:DNA translocase FtsK [Muribaculaceae bacterium]